MDLDPAAVLGKVLNLSEEDYRFGLGPLTLRVTRVLHWQELADGPWLYVRGVALRPDGSDGGSRQVLVRLSALPKQLWQPRPPTATAP